MVSKPVLALALIGLACAGCSAGSATSAPRAFLPSVVGPATGNPVGDHIKHVVLIIQENRSFENFFAGYPGADAPMYGFAEAPHGGEVKVPLHEITFQSGPNLHHDWQDAIISWHNGKMDGFSKFGQHHDDASYAYVNRTQLLLYWTMAQEYVLADHMFPTEFGPSFTAHLTLVAGTDNIAPDKAEINFPDHPYGCDAPPGTTSSTVNSHRHLDIGRGPYPCFTQFRTLAQTLDAAGISWRYYVNKRHYAGIWSAFEQIEYVHDGPDWAKDVIIPETRVLGDPGRGKLASVSWVTPSKANSDHPGAHSPQGPLWVASVVNAIGRSSYWNSTAIIILWDDWGGFYDNVSPPQLDYRGLGIRVPCLIISPYAKRGYVSHTQYEFGSILKFIEEAFDLPYLGRTSDGYTDERANSIEDSFDFTKPPRRFMPFALPPGTEARFRSEPPSDDPVDTE